MQTLVELEQFLKPGAIFRPFFKFSLLEKVGFPGLSQGTLTEMSGTLGSGKTEAVLRFLAENPNERVAWIEEDFTIYPRAFEPRGVSLSRVLFIEADREKDSLWSLLQILRSQLFGIIVYVPANGIHCDEVTLRRLQIMAERSNACVLILVESPLEQVSWPIATQLQVFRSPQSGEIDIEVVKYRQSLTKRSKS